MPKLIRLGRTFGLLNRRLVTDAGGAPCCCGGVCQCSPDLTPFRQRYTACNGGSKQYGQLLPVARLITVALQWSYFTETEVTVGRRGFPEFQISATQIQYSGSGVVCWRYNEQAQIARGASAWSYARVSNRGESVQEGGNEGGIEAFLFRGGPLAAVPAVIPPTDFEYPRYDMILPFANEYGGPIGPDWSTNLCAYNEDITERTGQGGPFGEDVLTNVYTYQYSDLGQAGSVIGANNFAQVNTQFPGYGSRRQVSSWALSWQRTFQSCDDGDTNPNAIGGGCAGCGDASLLQIL